jgi:hypothetical protein
MESRRHCEQASSRRFSAERGEPHGDGGFGFIGRFELHEKTRATHVPEHNDVPDRLKTYGSRASRMLQFGFGRIVKTIRCRRAGGCRNVDSTRTSDARFFSVLEEFRASSQVERWDS